MVPWDCGLRSRRSWSTVADRIAPRADDEHDVDDEQEEDDRRDDEQWQRRHRSGRPLTVSPRDGEEIVPTSCPAGYGFLRRSQLRLTG